MIYQIIMSSLLTYTALITILGVFTVNTLDSGKATWYKRLGISKEEAIRRVSANTNTHFILALCCVFVLYFKEAYNVL